MNLPRCARLIFAGFLVACASGSATGGSPPPPPPPPSPPPSPAPVATVTVSPSSPTVNVGATVQLTATTKDANGATLTGRVVTWSSNATSIATVNSSGLVSGVAAGPATITATSETKTGTASLAVAAVTSNNECASPQAGWIWCDDFETDRSSSYFEVDNAGGNFTRVAGVGFNGSSGMKAHYTAGANSVGSLHLAFGHTPQAYMHPVDAGTANYRELYYRLYLRRQPGWTGGGGDKVSRAMIFASPTTFAQAMIAHFWSGSSPNQDYFVIDPASGTDAQGNVITTTYNDFAHLTFLGAKRGAATIFSNANAGTWYCIESHVKLNTSGQSDGIQEQWIDGVLDVSSTNLNFVSSYNAYGLNAIYFENYWNNGSPQVQDRFMDRIVVSTQRVGC